MPSAPISNGYPTNPVVVRVLRAGVVESQHRGAWCLTDPGGTVLASRGVVEHGVYVRSSVKAAQALPLFESGAVERFGLDDEEIALAMASHGGEPCHTETVRRTLTRLGLEVGHLRCGAHPPGEAGARAALRARGEAPSALHNNCSGKHAGFLALARQLEVPVERYLDPASEGQVRVRRTLAELGGARESELVPGIDGCSAPTYRLSLRSIATLFARLANPDELGAERRAHVERMTRVAGAHPVLIGSSKKSLDTDLLRASGGRLFPKIGAEAVHAVGVVGGGRGLAVKIDDGGARALPVLVLALLEALGLARPQELERMGAWREPRLLNFAGLEVGSMEAVFETEVRA